MKFWMIVIFIVILIATAIIYFQTKEYYDTELEIAGYRVYDNWEGLGPTCCISTDYELFRNDEYKYVYWSHGCNISEFVVKLDGEYVPLSEFIISEQISNEEIEASGIGFRVDIPEATVVRENILKVEYTAENDWAGVGIYFYEEEGLLKCLYMIYGSGVPVAGYHVYSVTIQNGGDIIVIPNEDESGENQDDIFSLITSFTYEDGIIYQDDLVFENIGLSMYEYVLE